jgi:hypothetical protein
VAGDDGEQEPDARPPVPGPADPHPAGGGSGGGGGGGGGVSSLVEAEVRQRRSNSGHKPVKQWSNSGQTVVKTVVGLLGFPIRVWRCLTEAEAPGRRGVRRMWGCGLLL